jgi:hypothetical protein
LAETRKEFGDVMITLAVLAGRIDDEHVPRAQGESFINSGPHTMWSMLLARWIGDGDTNPGVRDRKSANYRS